jgi:5-deoxy-glucuronate isomerase
MSDLVIPRQQPDAEGNVHRITPETAGWTYVGFEVYALKKGQTLARETGDNEACVVLVTGKANIRTARTGWDNLGGRMDVFEKTPSTSVYVPNGDRWDVEALTDVEIGVGTAPGKGTYEARLISPEKVGVADRGSGNMQRLIHNILPEQEPADSLLMVEVFTPAGNWSSYPPHRHDRDNPPDEVYLEETYYHKINPAKGFAFQRVYDDDDSPGPGGVLAVHDGDVVMVPKGYHPCVAAPGYDLYYLNVMAGPKREWKFHIEPPHEWLAW